MQSDMEFEIHNLEQIAYAAVLRAFKAQSDALTWEKEGLITELRKELRVSDDEHRELLSEVNSDDLIRRIREWREAGGNRNVAINVPQHIGNQLQSPTFSASRKRQKSNPFGAPALHPPSVAGAPPPIPSAAKWGTGSGISGRRPHAVQPANTSAKPVQFQYVDPVSSAAPSDEPPDSFADSLIGRRVMIRWPADNNFYEAVISEYNPVDGRHSLVYDSNTPNATVEWVTIKEIPREDIRWLGNEPQLGETYPPTTGRVRPLSANELANEARPTLIKVHKEDDSEEIEILHTETLIKKVEKMLDASHPDLLEIGKAKKMLKDHEQSLIEVIAKLSAACGDSEDERQSSQGHLLGRQHNVDNLNPSNDFEEAVMPDS